MPELNNLQVIGYTGSEPELRFTPNGRPVCNFSMATNRSFISSDGEKKKETEWFNVVCWGRLAETVNQFVVKGMLVYISGAVHLHKWETLEKVEKSRLQINAMKVVFLNRPDGTGYQPYDLPEGVDNEEYIPDDIPF